MTPCRKRRADVQANGCIQGQLHVRTGRTCVPFAPNLSPSPSHLPRQRGDECRLYVYSSNQGRRHVFSTGGGVGRSVKVTPTKN